MLAIFAQAKTRRHMLNSNKGALILSILNNGLADHLTFHKFSFLFFDTVVLFCFGLVLFRKK